MLKHILTILVLALVFTACQNDADKKGKEDMSQFAEDEAFQNAHDEPGAADAQMNGSMIEFPTEGGQPAKAYALMQPDSTPTNDYLFVIHEWWGLNDHIKQEAERLYEELGNANVMALDLYDGKVATKREQAGKLMESVDETRVQAIIQGAINKAGANAQISTIGWCFGGGWSLRSAIMAGEQAEACVMYYGMPVKEASAIEPLEAPVLFVLARNDKWITPQVAKDFMTMMKENDKTMQLMSYDADHAFANPTQESYKEQQAKAANAASLKFLRDNMFAATPE
jgi:carboxymethylenebutenolidase